MYASTGDKDGKSKADYMVAEMARCQARLGGKYLSAFPTAWWDRLERGQRLTEAHIAGPNLRVGAANIEQHGSPLAPINRTPPVPEIEIPTFRGGPDLASWIKPTDEPQTFRTVGQKRDVTLLPLNKLFDRRYSVYWQVT